MQADGADELLLETVPPRLSHVRGHHGGAGRHALTVTLLLPRPLGLCAHRKPDAIKTSLEKQIKTAPGAVLKDQPAL